LKTVADMSSGRDNHFNLIRLIAAGAVLVSHSYPLTFGMGSAEPLEAWTGHSLGTSAVYVFFGISGYMITRSFERRRDIWSFGAARIARIFPGLLVALLLTALVLGPIATRLPMLAYFGDPLFWSYIPSNVSLRFLQYDLPGVFEDNIYPKAINGSLWTLFWEVACYTLVVVLGCLGGMKERRFFVFLVFYIALVMAMCITSPNTTWVNLSVPFVTGMAIYVYRGRVPTGLFVLVLVTLVALLARDTIFWDVIYGTALAYAALLLGHVQAPALLAFNRLGDYSYGTYIYAFPVQQVFAWLAPGVPVIGMIWLTLPITVVLAVISWHFVEAPALERREKLAESFRRWLYVASKKIA
jgi:peptidoglycan/LPS O-acetylase OafA/YrhL